MPLCRNGCMNVLLNQDRLVTVWLIQFNTATQLDSYVKNNNIDSISISTLYDNYDVRVGNIQDFYFDNGSLILKMIDNSEMLITI